MINSRLATWVLVILVLSNWAQADNEINGIVDDALSTLSSDNPSLTVISLGNFTYADKEVGSSFSRYLQELLSSSLTRSSSFELFARDRLEQILETMELNLSDLVDRQSATRIGALKGIQGLLGGRFFDAGSHVRVFLELVEIETGIVRSKISVDLPRSLIPSTLSIQPDNYSDAMFVLEELQEVQNAGNRSFVVKTWTTRGNGGTYRDGEFLVINFFVNRDCYIKLYHIDVNKKMKLIFPNQYYENNFIREKKIYKIPDSSYPFKFSLTQPYGTEFIKVIASTLQFKDIESSFQEIGTASRGAIHRGLNIKANKNQVTEAMISYTIIE